MPRFKIKDEVKLHKDDLPTRVTTDTGAIRETEYHKGPRGYPLRFDLILSNDVGFRRLAETFGEGFLKYGADNWKKGFKESVLVNHALEHIRLHIAKDTTEDHVTHALWNLYTLTWVQENLPQLMDLTGTVSVAG